LPQGELAADFRQPELRERGDIVPHKTKGQSDAPALEAGVDAETAGVRRIGKIELSLFVEPLPLLIVGYLLQNGVQGTSA
ncbi:MAG: hypothetical protein ABR978_06825, partial [Dehalococcoidia bacterium]